MKQLVQDLKKGKMKILEVPFPALAEGGVLVRSHYSVISAGTEGKTVTDARKGYIAKARGRQKEVKQVIQAAKTQGMIATYKMVMNKLEAPSGLGYSCAGEVIAVGRKVTEFKVGNRVACGGAGAAHAEVVAVPKNLCAKVPDGVEMKEAAFATIAAIAMQGVRQAELKLGETAVVIGLGLVGQLTLQLLHASGVAAVGIDIDPAAVALAKKTGLAHVFKREHAGLEQKVLKISSGLGADAVIITASASSLDPVNLAGALCRKKGRVVVVGGVPTGFEREHYYKKELELLMSCSYGPGRYDANYEEKGNDYPPGYVRWTENRNMQAYLALLKDKKLQVDKLITHEFELERAADAYAMILSKAQPFCGVVLKYDAETRQEERVVLREGKGEAAEPHIGFIGAGSFAQNILLPAVKAAKTGAMIGVATARPNNARNVADKYGFAYCTGNADEIIADNDINTVFIATRHDSHAKYVLAALKSGKNVFVEKPICLTEAELMEISSLYSSLITPLSGDLKGHHSSPLLMVGFNRRFAPLIQKLMATLPTDLPKAINYRINSGSIPPGHWIHDPETGGGRVIGEVCHFVDLAMFIAGAPVTQVSANLMASAQNLEDTLVVNLAFTDGSVAAISYFSNGSPQLPKERLEVFCAGQAAILEDFKTLTVYDKKISQTKLSRLDKGHAREVELFLNAIKKGEACPISFADIHLSTLATLKIIEAFKSKTAIHL
ncbi:MAG: bi-domain-containing oxidoreductase [Chrysiogenia bacterium]